MKNEFGELWTAFKTLEQQYNLSYKGTTSILLLGIWDELRKFNEVEEDYQIEGEEEEEYVEEYQIVSPFRYSRTSLERLRSCHIDLQYIFTEVLSYGIFDITIVEGTRNQEDQNKYFEEGKSKVKFPMSSHNTIPSRAVDAVLFVDGKPSWNTLHCCILAGMVLSCAKRRGIRLTWGGNWDGDKEPITDQDFQDLGHYELEL